MALNLPVVAPVGSQEWQRRFKFGSQVLARALAARGKARLPGTPKRTLDTQNLLEGPHLIQDHLLTEENQRQRAIPKFCRTAGLFWQDAEPLSQAKPELLRQRGGKGGGLFFRGDGRKCGRIPDPEGAAEGQPAGFS